MRVHLPFLDPLVRWRLLVALGLASAFALPLHAAEGDAPLPARLPEFELTTLDGETLSPASLRGKVVVLNFWATWCPDCHQALPTYRALQDEFRDTPDFVFLAIALDEDRTADFLRRFVEKHHINYRVALGDKALTERFGGIGEIPTTLIVDRDGVVRFRKPGATELAELRQQVRALL